MMRTNHILKYFIPVVGFLSLLLIVIPVQQLKAQGYEELRKEIQKKQEKARTEIDQLKNEIQQAQLDLRSSGQRYDRIYAEYQSLQREISLRDALITKLQSEREHILEEIDLLNNSFATTEVELSDLNDKYKETIVYLYKHGRISDVAIILSSTSINQMLVRSKYLRKFDLHLQKIERSILEKQEELKEKQEQLISAKQRNESNEDELVNEKRSLNRKRNTQQSNISSLRQNQQKTRERLKELQNQINTFNNTLADLLEEEEKVRRAQVERNMRLERERLKRLQEAEQITDAEERAKEVEKYSKPVGKTDILDTIDYSQLERSFLALKGKLPSPVENGVVTRKIGTHVDPLYGTKIDYPGITIAVKPRSAVRVIHDGRVFAVRPIPGYGDVVFVKHGAYLTAYGNLSSVKARENTFVKAGEIIGLSGDQNSANGASLFFMVRKETKNLNPEQWIVSK